MIEGQWVAVLTAMILFALPGAVWAHEQEAHGKAKGASSPQYSEEALAAVAGTYEARVKDIFESSCADCHGAATEKPWYYHIPGVRHLIDSDIREAREHLDLRKGFPFGGHGTPPEDLKAIAKALREGSMPPLRYRWLHGDAALTESQRAVVLEWVRKSLRHLESAPPGGQPPSRRHGK